MSHQLDHINQTFSRAPVYEAIFSCLSPRELIRVSRTCQVAHDAFQSFIHRAYNINRHLSRFLTDPISFQSLQARTGTLISGSNALQFLDRTRTPEYPGIGLVPNLAGRSGHLPLFRVANPDRATGLWE
ncbi:hypothetical protein CONPUDRAFT_160756 [Coniophora puteana RWD-64-598 SS2]|uniref:F-box domain-containing protein n=1 Tax=Coniophora puteana (strain RWD-64-598) TaxID=741705 RepID=R7SC56_CONPW|nr:uncharacterized protein CONPUDRAFT_160756 [Coniophora puteana RWD-64-598 SS2]EIW73751.1 hypothetical protein CONPUDRAFT_160756 [Coniophora puteana RWD-64-598 SS2]